MFGINILIWVFHERIFIELTSNIFVFGWIFLFIIFLNFHNKNDLKYWIFSNSIRGASFFIIAPILFFFGYLAYRPENTNPLFYSVIFKLILVTYFLVIFIIPFLQKKIILNKFFEIYSDNNWIKIDRILETLGISEENLDEMSDYINTRTGKINYISKYHGSFNRKDFFELVNLMLDSRYIYIYDFIVSIKNIK